MSEDTEFQAGVAAEKLAQYFAVLDECDDKCATIMATAMAECKEAREAEKRAYKMIVAEGANKLGLKLETKLHKIKRKASIQIQNALDDEEDETLVSAEAIRNAIGSQLIELPLGQWGNANPKKTEAHARDKAAKAGKATEAEKAAKKPGRKKGGAKVDTSAAAKADALKVGEDDDVDLRPTDLKRREAERQAEAADRLKGIKPLGDDQQPTAH